MWLKSDTWVALGATIILAAAGAATFWLAIDLVTLVSLS